MNLLEHTSDWVKGEVAQGKVMVVISLLLVVALVLIWKSDHILLRGMMIPLSLIIFVTGGYGGFQIFGRPGHVNKVQKVYDQNPQEALQQQHEYARDGDKTYSRLKPVWAVLIVISLVLFFVFKEEQRQGLAIGLALLFLTLLMLDTTLHSRLKVYLSAMQNLMS